MRATANEKIKTGETRMYRENKPIHLSPYDHPDIYPGPRPPSSFLYFAGKAHRIQEQTGVPVEELIVHYARSGSLEGSFARDDYEEVPLAEFLARHDLLPIAQRVPLVAYGSNVCLAQLKYKFSLNPNLNDFVICLRGRMFGSDIIYGSTLAPYGALPAVIAPVPEAVTEIWLTFVDPEQLKHLNATEGGYELREHRDKKIVLETDERFGLVYAYYLPRALTIGDRWFRFRDIGGTSPLQAYWQADMLNWVKELARFPGTREEFIHRLRWNSDFFAEIAEMLSASYEETFQHPDWHPAKRIQTVQSVQRVFDDHS